MEIETITIEDSPKKSNGTVQDEIISYVEEVPSPASRSSTSSIEIIDMDSSRSKGDDTLWDVFQKEIVQMIEKTDKELLVHIDESSNSSSVELFENLVSEKEAKNNYNCDYCQLIYGSSVEFTFYKRDDYLQHISNHTKESSERRRKGLRLTSAIDKLDNLQVPAIKLPNDTIETAEQAKKDHQKKVRFFDEAAKDMVTPSKTNEIQVNLPVHKCIYCNSSFFEEEALVDHIMVHTEEKTLNCAICSKSFVTKSNFNRHMKIHQPKEYYQCQECDRSFKKKRELDRHFRQSHLQVEP